MPQNNQTKYLTGIRALGVLMVFMVRIVQGYTISSPYLSALIYMTQYGVILFFLISAYTIYMSISNTKDFSFKRYLTKRVLRIIPMYYLVIIVVFVFGGAIGYEKIFGISNGLKSLFMNLSFLNLFDIRYRQSILYVSWTIPVEMFMYLLLPLAFFYLSKDKKRIVNLLLVTFIISIASQLTYLRFYPLNYQYYALHWSVLFYLFTYVLGIAVYLLVEKKLITYKLSSLGLILILAIFVIYPRVINTDNDITNTIFMTIWSALVLFASTAGSKLSKLLFENPVAIYIGNISYSFYLIHFSIMQIFPAQNQPLLLRTIIVLTITIVISHLTYTFIEKPFIKLADRKQTV